MKIIWLAIALLIWQLTDVSAVDSDTKFEHFLNIAVDGYPAWLNKKGLSLYTSLPSGPAKLSFATGYLNYTGEIKNKKVFSGLLNATASCFVSDHNFEEKDFSVVFYPLDHTILVHGEFEIKDGSFLNGIKVSGKGTFTAVGHAPKASATFSDFEVDSKGFIDLSKGTYTFEEDPIHYYPVSFQGLKAGGFENIVGSIIWENYHYDLSFSKWKVISAENVKKYFVEVFKASSVKKIMGRSRV